MFKFLRFLSIAFLACLISSCTVRPTSPAQNTDTPVPVGIVSPEPAPPVRFTARELLPFAFTPDGARLLLRTGQGVQVINLASGQEEDFLPASQMVVFAALSTDGETLAWSLEGGTIELVRMADHQILHTLSGHPDTVFDLRFSPDGEALFSASHDGWVRIWDTQEGTLQPSIQAGREILGFGIHPLGTRLATISADGPVQLWDFTANELVMELEATGGYDTSDAVFSPDGQYMAADLATGIYLWRVSDGELIWNAVNNSMAVAFSPDGQYLAYADIDDGNRVVLASPDGVRTIQMVDSMQGPVWELFFSPDSSMLAATDGIEVRIWQIPDGALLFVGTQESSAVPPPQEG